MKNDPLKTIQKLIKDRYSHAKAAFWAGSVSQNQGTEASDLDLVIVFESIAHAYREAFIYDRWPVDVFIHDPDTLRYFCNKLEMEDGRPALINMILNGYEMLEPNDFAKKAKLIAQETLNAGPTEWNENQIDRERFLITDILDDIQFPKNRDEQLISGVHLFEPLIQFYFRADKKWAASGKALMRLLKFENSDLAIEFNQGFEQLFQTGDTLGIQNIVHKILAPYGGLLWDGFKSDAPPEWKITDKHNALQNLKIKDLSMFHELEASLLEPSTRKSIEKLDALLAEDFYEIGASGNIYNKKAILESLRLEQIDSPYGKIIDFEAARITEDLTRVNYLLKEKIRTTRRTSIWKNRDNNYQMIFHQGTVINAN